jgi:uncharacterized protein involved in type VI secretion and phage assembly
MEYEHADPSMMNDMAQAMESRFYGKYSGTVESNKDTTGRGRLCVKVPAVMGGQPVWARPCVPYAGDNAGSYMIPEKHTLVWVEFEAGDPSYPIWTGCFWPDKKAPKNNANQAAKPGVKIIRSKEGLIVSLDDSGQVIHVSDKDGSNVLTIEVTKGKITIKGATKAVVEAPQIELVENATHPVVFGDQLLNYLNQIVQLYQSHTHPGELAAGFIPVSPALPVPPFPPATPALISKKVKTG